MHQAHHLFAGNPHVSVSSDKEHPVASLSDLRIKIFADGADRNGILEMTGVPYIRGFTTNPTLMRQAGISDFEGFAREIIPLLNDRPISLEVFTDEFDEMERQALKIASWGTNVFVKIPVTNTRGESSCPLIGKLSEKGLRLNVTAMTTLDQVERVSHAMRSGNGGILSVFAGRIADTGRDPVPLMRCALEIINGNAGLELLWGSPREILNVFQAESIGCHIITVTNELLKKASSLGKDLETYSLETVRMFYNDARTAGYRI